MHTPGESREKAGRIMGVSPRGVTAAKRILGDTSSAIPELQQAVRNEETSLSAAATISGEPDYVQEMALAGGRKGVAKAAKSKRMSDDELFEQAVEYACEKGRVSSQNLQVKFIISSNRAMLLYRRLVDSGVVDPVTRRVIKSESMDAQTCDLEMMLLVFAESLSDDLIPLYIDLLYTIAATPNVEAIQRVARRVSED